MVFPYDIEFVPLLSEQTLADIQLLFCSEVTSALTNNSQIWVQIFVPKQVMIEKRKFSYRKWICLRCYILSMLLLCDWIIIHSLIFFNLIKQWNIWSIALQLNYCNRSKVNVNENSFCQKSKGEKLRNSLEDRKSKKT